MCRGGHDGLDENHWDSATGRTSTIPPAGQRFAMVIASSSLATSTMHHRQVLLAHAAQSDAFRAATEAFAFDDLARVRVLGEPLTDLGDAGIPLGFRKRHPLILGGVKGEHVTHCEPPASLVPRLHDTDEGP